MSNPSQNIIVVDDDPEMSLALWRLLNAAGFKARTFPSAEALLASGAAATAGCLILDINLPGISGFELRRQLEQNGGKTRVIFITAFDEPESELEAEAAGAVAYLTKPFQGSSLIGAIKEALQSHEHDQSRV
jgi:FixJ family two-component response regulator